MKNRLFLTTAICALALAVGISGVQAVGYGYQAHSNEVRTTTTTIHIYDFPDSDPVNISRHVRKIGRCPTCSDGDQFANLICNTESCFAYDAKVLMADGTVKKIGEIVVGDNTAYGAVRQTYIRRFDQGRTATQDFQIVYRGGLYEYRGILVTGNHVVKTNGRWTAIAELDDVQPVFAPHVGNVYNLDVEGGVIPVPTRPSVL